jgi:NAD(P)-dependent dehydrogenase (short-subunit alcohol dehydrogenase family)
MRPVTDTVVLVTGATDGLGRAVAGVLAARGAVVHLHGRSPERLAETVDEIRAATPDARLSTHVADFASLEDIRRLGDEVAALPALHVLLNNAGVGGVPRQLSTDGYELHLAVNHLAGFALTRRLLPLLEASAPARVVFVASLGQAPTDFDDPQLERGYDPLRAYGQSKLAQIATAFTLAERLDPEQVTVNSLHPATLMPTKMVRDGFGRTVDDLQTGVDAVVRLAIDPALDGVSGRFYDRQREARPDAWALDPDNRRRLWELSERLTA